VLLTGGTLLVVLHQAKTAADVERYRLVYLQVQPLPAVHANVAGDEATLVPIEARMQRDLQHNQVVPGGVFRREAMSKAPAGATRHRRAMRPELCLGAPQGPPFGFQK
jgi:hypothetical protein